MNKTTCGPLYLEGLKEYTDGNPDLVRVYAAGFINGQAEKVYLGACQAAMFRPNSENQKMVADIACEAAQRYDDLWVALYEDEVWICRGKFIAGQVEALKYMEIDSPRYHNHRAWLCGIPGNEIDLEFHKRKGYGERCDG